MRLLVQRVNHAQVSVDQKVIGHIQKGYLIYLGIHKNDTQAICDQVAEKIKNLRIFADENEKLNLTLEQVKGDILLISQFTLYGTVKKHNRPSFTESAPYDVAYPLYEYLIAKLRETTKVETGQFGAHMHVSLENDGPINIMIQVGEDISI